MENGNSSRPRRLTFGCGRFRPAAEATEDSLLNAEFSSERLDGDLSSDPSWCGRVEGLKALPTLTFRH